MKRARAKSMLELERLAIIDFRAEQLSDALENDNISKIQTNLKHVLRNPKTNIKSTKNKKHQRLFDDEGVPVSSREDERILFRNEFSDQLAGTLCTFAQLVSDDRNSQLEQPIIIPDPATVQTKDIPNMYDIAQVFAGRKKGKGCGEGLLVSDLFRRFPKIMSQVYYPIILKSYARLHPPTSMERRNDTRNI